MRNIAVLILVGLMLVGLRAQTQVACRQMVRLQWDSTPIR